jgi:hypothetical protein
MADMVAFLDVVHNKKKKKQTNKKRMKKEKADWVWSFGSNTMEGNNHLLALPASNQRIYKRVCSKKHLSKKGRKCFTLLSKSNPHYKPTPKVFFFFFFLDDEKDSIAADSSNPVNLDKGGRCDGDGG